MTELKQICRNESGSLTLYHNKNQFVITIILGHAETYYSVGYSSPNGADLDQEYEDFNRYKIFVNECQLLIDNYEHIHDINDDSSMIMNLLSIVKEVNLLFNTL